MTVLALFGEGKGKTTSAIGQAVRALGHDSNSIIIAQFNKNDDSIGEFKFFFKKHPMINCEIIHFGAGCTHPTLRKQQRCMECGECGRNVRLNRTKVEWAIQKIIKKEPKYGVIILDEILISLSYGYITTKEIEDLVATAPEKTWILTGRLFSVNTNVHVPNRLWMIEFADYVTEMVQHKHPYNRGVTARKGVEY